MRGIHGDVPRYQRAKTMVPMAGQRLNAAPEHAVMHDEQLCADFDGAVRRFAREIHRCCDVVDRADVRELDPVHRGWIIRNPRDV